MANYDLTNLALKAAFPTNSIITDDKGLPSVMVYIPKFKISDVITGGASSTHPAFIVNGTEVAGIYISKYQNVMYNGRAYSLPGEDPKASINFETALGYCTAKGAGWHIMTVAEWAAIALWCKKNNFLPYGNNSNGKDSRETVFKAIPTYYESNNIARVGTGTGPVTWSHDNTPAGIWDLNGNVNEWQGGYRTVKGEIQIIENNNAADDAILQTATSTAWKAIDATTGALITPNGTGTTPNSVKLDFLSSKWTYSNVITVQADAQNQCLFVNIACAATISDAAKAVLKAYGLLPDDIAFDYQGDYWYANNGADERVASRGGSWNYGTNAGLFYSGGNSPRANANTSIGFRSAYIPGI